MLLSLITAWLTVICFVFAAFKYIARISGSKPLNRFFRKIHLPFGTMMLIFGVIHALLAGNPSSATLSTMSIGSVLFTLNWGTAAIAAAILLALTYLFRKKLRKKWMPLHRVLTVAMLLFLVLHIANMGIQIDNRLFPSQTTGVTTSAVTTAAAQSTTASTAASTAAAASSTTAAASTTAASSTTASSTTALTEAETQALVAEANATFSGATLADGTYQGSANGYKGTITVSVTVSGGKVTNIAVVSESDTAQFFSQAESVLTTIVSEQSLQVDAVSGATYSSSGLVNATYNALQSAVTSGTLSVTTFNLSAAKGH